MMIERPNGVTITREGNVLIISENRVLKVTRGGPNELLIKHLTNPRRLAIDRSCGDVLVAEGTGDWRVKRFTRSGEPKQTYGRNGGRLEGEYEPGHFRGITDLTYDGSDGFFVAEPDVAPRRVVHIDRDGHVKNEWHGGLPFFAWRSIDSRDPTRVWYQANDRWAVLAEVNYATGHWTILETHDIGSKANGLARGSFRRKNAGWVVRYRNGKRYLVAESFPQVMHHENHQLHPVVISHRSGRLGPLKESESVPRELITIGTLKDKRDPGTWAREHFGDTYPDYNTYLWTDRNGDHKPQGEEITLHKLGNIYAGPGRGTSVANDFSLLMTGARDVEDGKFTPHLYRVSPAYWTNGVPHYSFPDEQWGLDTVANIPQHGIGDGRIKGRSTFTDETGAAYAFYGYGPGYAGSWPTATYGGISRLTKWNRDGTLMWSVGREATVNNRDVTAVTPPGQIHDPARINGQVRNTIVVTDRVVNPGMAWTTDGLYAGSFHPGRVNDGLPGWVYAWFWDVGSDHAALVGHDCLDGGRVLEHNDKVYWLAPGGQSIPVYQIHGYDRERWHRQSQTILIREEARAAKGEGIGLTFERYTNQSPSGVPEVTRTVSEPHDLDVKPDTFIRLTGLIEAPLSETYTFMTGGGRVRLWVDGRQVQHTWNHGYARELKYDSTPIQLKAGERVPFQLDFYSSREEPTLKLLWKSFNTDLRPISKKYLYNSEIAVFETTDPRPATSRLPVQTFDATITSGNFMFDTFAWKTCRCFLRGLNKPGSHLGYRNIDFGDGVSDVTVMAQIRGGPLPLEFRIGGPDGQTIGTLEELKTTGGEMKKRSAAIEGPEGVHDLYLVHPEPHNRPGSGTIHPRWIRFNE